MARSPNSLFERKRKARRAILLARTDEEVILALDNAIPLLDDRESERILNERIIIWRKKFTAIEMLARRHNHPGCNTGAHRLACQIVKILDHPFAPTAEG